MKKGVFGIVALAALLAIGEDTQVLNGVATNKESVVRQVVSQTITEKAWKRDVVMVDESNHIIGDGGVVGTKIETEAIDEVARRTAEISDAAKAAMETALDTVYAKTNNMAKSGIGFALAFAPETEDVNIRGFVVKTETVGSTDTQYVWYNASFATAPVRYVTYDSLGHRATVKCNWGKWSPEGESLTHNGKTWSGVHKCTVIRPTWAVGKSCLDEPNETWGGENGMDFGTATLEKESGVAYYTGYVENVALNLKAYFDNGFLKAIVPINENGEEN